MLYNAVQYCTVRLYWYRPGSGCQKMQVYKYDIFKTVFCLLPLAFCLLPDDGDATAVAAAAVRVPIHALTS